MRIFPHHPLAAAGTLNDFNAAMGRAVAADTTLPERDKRDGGFEQADCSCTVDIFL
jgi:hypothetical protein